MQYHACFGSGAVGGIPSDRALIIDLRAGLATHLGQAIFGESEGLSHSEFRRRRRPRWSVSDGQRLIDLTSATGGIGVNQVGRQQLARASCVAQERQDGSHRWLAAHSRDEEPILALVIKFHRQGRRARRMRPPVNPGKALAVLEGESFVGVRRLHRRVNGRVGADDFKILGGSRITRAHHRQRQQGQRIRFHQQGARHGCVVESVSRVGSHDLVGFHRWPLINRVCMCQQQVGLRGVGRIRRC